MELLAREKRLPLSVLLTQKKIELWKIGKNLICFLELKLRSA